MDNGTLVEAFKYLHYRKLATSCLVSKRFWNLIRTHRNSLARLYVNIRMHRCPNANAYAPIKVFNNVLSPKAFNEWIIFNGYSKQVPLEDQVAGMQITQYDGEVYEIRAEADYKDQNHRRWGGKTTVFFARTKLYHEYWPLFEHFVKLVNDPFIYIHWLEFPAQNAALYLLAKAVNPDRRLQCEILSIDFEGNIQKLTNWIKNHVWSNECHIRSSSSNYDEVLLDFFMSAAQCTSAIKVDSCYNFPEVVVAFAQKFMDLLNWNESHIIQSMESIYEDRMAKVLKNHYAKFMVKEEEVDGKTEHVFEFINIDIGKKLQLTAENFHKVVDVFDDGIYFDVDESYFSLKIENL